MTRGTISTVLIAGGVLAFGAHLANLSGSPLLQPALAAIVQGGIPPATHCYNDPHIGPCTSCDDGTLDVECRTGHEFKTCRGTDHTCPSTALCNQAIVSGVCGS